MKKNKLREKSEKDLMKQLADKRTSLREFRFGAAGSKTKNVRAGRNTRRDIARILTELESRS